MSGGLSKAIDLSKKALRRLAGSASILTLISLFGFSYLVEKTQPLNLLFCTGLTTIRQNNMVGKLPKIISSSENPQVLMLGTSLSLYPMAHLDDVMKDGKTRWDSTYVRYQICPYSRANYLEKELSEKLDRKIKAVNASVVAAVVSDQYLILEKYLKSGKKPELVLLFMAPRDLCANNKSQIGKSPTFEILSDMQNFDDLLATKPDFASLTEFAISKVWTYAAARNDYKSIFAQAASRLTGHPVDLYTAKQQISKGEKVEKPANIFEVDKYWEAEAVYQQPRNELKQLNDYREIYTTFSEEQFQNQKTFLEKLFKLAQDNDVPVCVVNMPLTRQNYDLMQKGKYDLKRFEDTVQEVASRYQVPIVEPGKTNGYDLDDFEDCAHLNLKGGTKLFSAVTDAICSNQRIAARLTGSGVMVGAGSVPATR